MKKDNALTKMSLLAELLHEHDKKQYPDRHSLKEDSYLNQDLLQMCYLCADHYEWHKQLEYDPRTDRHYKIKNNAIMNPKSISDIPIKDRTYENCHELMTDSQKIKLLEHRVKLLFKMQNDANQKHNDLLESLDNKFWQIEKRYNPQEKI